MRVITGVLGGRVFESPAGHRTHPMSEKVRGAIFNMLGDINGLTILDVFAGSGAISFEAISRGAKSAIAIDNDKNAAQTIKRNIKSLNIGNKVDCIQASANSWSREHEDNRFDLVICDPPYDQIAPDLLTQLAGHTTINGLLILSLPPDQKFTVDSRFELVAEKSYGDATLVIYRRIS